MKNPIPNYLTVNQIQEKTLVDKDVIRRHIRLGRLKSIQLSGRGTHLISISDYEDWAKNVAKVREIKEKEKEHHERRQTEYPGRQELTRIEAKLDVLIDYMKQICE